MKKLPLIIGAVLMATPAAAEIVTNDVWETVSPLSVQMRVTGLVTFGKLLGK